MPTNQYNCLINTAYSTGLFLGKYANADQYAFYINGGFMTSGAGSLTRDSTIRMVVATSDGNGNGTIYVQGQGVWTSAAMSTAALTAQAVTLFQEVGSNGCLYGDMYLAAIWNRVLGAGEVAMLYGEPYAMFRPVMPSYVMQGPQAAPGGGSQTVTWVGYIG